MKKRKYFLGLMIAEIALFVLCCASIILCVLNSSSVPADKKVEHTMSFVFLFFHLVIVGILFIYTLKAYLAGSMFIQIVTTKENGEKNKKTVVVCSVLAGIFAIIAVFFVTVLCGVDSFGKIFSMGLQFALTNAGFTVATLCLFLVFYKPDDKEK
ncbi:MAG: hypothetical protein KBS97_03955 [Firmicutes bacterium]|nr:hypothetical protein [Candidatus Fiminaster equi]